MKERSGDTEGSTRGAPSSQVEPDDVPRLDPEAKEMTRRQSSLSLKSALPVLRSSSDWAEIERLLVALHHKFWHASASALYDLLERAGVPKAVLDHIKNVVPHKCKRCMQHMHAKHRPKVNTWFGRFFNHVVQADLFFLWDRIFIILIDECTRYKFADELPSKSYE